MQELVTNIIDHYRVEQLLARGGMAEVYLAQDIHTGKRVAVKLVHSSAVEYSERFRIEAETLAKLAHEHILPVIEYGKYESWHYLVTPYIPGGTLNRRLKKGPLSCEHTGELLEQLAEALQFAHEQGLVHRDIKASNVLMRDEHFIYLADFGLVKNVDQIEGLTTSGYVLGTPEYMAPELAYEQATPLSDLYALGILLYYMLTGQLPFKGNTPLSICITHLRDFPLLPSILNPSIPESVERVILRALEKDPKKRFQTAREFSQAYWQALREDQHAQMVAATQIRMPMLKIPEVSIHKIPQSRRRPKLVTSLLGLASIGVVLSLPGLPQGELPFPVRAEQHPIVLHVNRSKSPTAAPTSIPAFHSAIAESSPSPANSQNNTPPDSRGAGQSANDNKGPENGSGNGNGQSYSNQNPPSPDNRGRATSTNDNGGGSSNDQSYGNQNNTISVSSNIQANVQALQNEIRNKISNDQGYSKIKIFIGKKK